MKTIAPASCPITALIVILGITGTARAQVSLEDRYIVSRDAAIKKLKPLYDTGSMDDAGTKTEDLARANLEMQLHAILGPLGYEGFGPGHLNLGSLYEGDEGFGTVDGLRFDAKIGKTGETAGGKDKDGNYIEPKAHIVVTTQTMFARWLRAHKDWWDKGANNVPQKISAAFEDESFYTQAFATGSAVVKFNDLPLTKPASATLAYAMLAGRTQSEVPDAADEVYVAALAKGKVYVAFSSIDPKVQIAGCDAIRADFNKRAQDSIEEFRQNRIDKNAYDQLGNLRQEGEDAFKRCFIQRAPKQSAFGDAKKQAQSLLETAVGK